MKLSESHHLREIRLRQFVHVMLIALLLGSSFAYPAVRQESLEGLGLVASPDIPAPNVRLPDLKGQTVNLEDHRGKVVMLYFWTTW